MDFVCCFKCINITNHQSFKTIYYILRMSTQIDFRTLPTNVPSLCIPRVFSNWTEGRIRRVFDDLSMGEIQRIDVVSKTTEKGEKFNRVFVHFKRWFSNENADMTRERVLNGKEIKIVYDDPWFWKVSAYREPKKQTNGRERPRASIQFDDEDKPANNRPDNKPYNRPDNRPDNKPYNRPDNRPDNKPYNRPDNRPDNKPYAKNRPDNKPYNRPDNKPYAKNRPDNRPYNKPDNNKSIGMTQPVRSERDAKESCDTSPVVEPVVVVKTEEVVAPTSDTTSSNQDLPGININYGSATTIPKRRKLKIKKEPVSLKVEVEEGEIAEL